MKEFSAALPVSMFSLSEILGRMQIEASALNRGMVCYEKNRRLPGERSWILWYPQSDDVHPCEAHRFYRVTVDGRVLRHDWDAHRKQWTERQISGGKCLCGSQSIYHEDHHPACPFILYRGAIDRLSMFREWWTRFEAANAAEHERLNRVAARCGDGIPGGPIY